MLEKRLFFVWFLIIFFMVGYNILVLKNPELYSSNSQDKIIMIFKHKLNNLSMLQLKEDKIKKEKLALMSKLFKKLAIHKKQPTESKEAKQVNLPSIQGIISILGLDGNIHRRVLIDGKGYVERQNINGFLIEKITNKGVYLSKNNKKWFVSLPEVKFSIVKE